MLINLVLAKTISLQLYKSNIYTPVNQANSNGRFTMLSMARQCVEEEVEQVSARARMIALP